MPFYLISFKNNYRHRFHFSKVPVKLTAALLIITSSTKNKAVAGIIYLHFTLYSECKSALLTDALLVAKKINRNSLWNFDKRVFNYHLPVNQWLNLFRPQPLQIVVAWPGGKIFPNVSVNKGFFFSFWEEIELFGWLFRKDYHIRHIWW